MLFRIENRSHGRWLAVLGGIVVVAMAVGTMRIGFTRSFTIVVGMLLFLYFPGWWVSFVEFPLSDRFGDETTGSSHRTLDIIERITLAVALSIVLSSATVFVLYIFPGGGALNAENFAIAIILLNIMLFAAAGGRKKWIQWIPALVLGIFPLIVIAVNQIFAVATTTKNFAIEILFLLLVLLIIRIVTPRP